MNILILFSQPWRVGGAETHVEALVQGWAGDKLFLAVNEGSDVARLQQFKAKFPAVKIITIQARGINIFRWRQDIVKLAALIATESIDVVSAQQRTAGLWAYVLQRKTGVLFTVTMHDPWHRAMFKSLYASKFPKVIAVSYNLAEQLIKEFNFSSQAISVINNGIDFAAFVPKPKAKCRESLSLDPQAKLILHVSRLSKVKGAVALALIESMPILWQEYPAAQLIIIGEGPLRGAIDAKIQEFNQRYGAKIKIYNFVDNLLNWYNAADILVGEGRVAIEALACHKPIVAIRNTQFFIGAITPDNIVYACDVNFDGKDEQVTSLNIVREIIMAFALETAQQEKIAEYIKGRLSIAKMTADYLTVFKQLK